MDNLYANNTIGESICQEEKNIPTQKLSNDLTEVKNKVENAINAIMNDTKKLNENENLNTTTIKSGIYLIVNKINKKWYVGSSNNILGVSGRWMEHIRLLRRNKHENSKFQRAWNKYGECNFEFLIIEETGVDKKALHIVEQKYLDYAKTITRNVYNLSFIASGGGFEGFHHTKESKEKISAKLKGRESHWKNKKRPNWIPPLKGKYYTRPKKYIETYLTGERNPRWINIDTNIKEKIWKYYNTYSFNDAKIKVKKELTLGSAVFKRIVKEYKQKYNIEDKNKDFKIYYFENSVTKEKFIGNKINFIKKYNLGNGSNVYKMVYQNLTNGKKLSVKNWTIKPEN